MFCTENVCVLAQPVEGDGVDLGLNTYMRAHATMHTHTQVFKFIPFTSSISSNSLPPHHPPSQITIWLIHTVSTIHASWRHLKFVHTIALTLGQI